MAKSIPITDFKDLRKLYTKGHQNRDPARSKVRTIYALDTETADGNIFLIADSDGQYLDKISPESVIKFLFHKKYQNSWNFFYNLSYDASVILKLLGNTLYKYKTTRELSFKFKNFAITYIPNKCLRIAKGHHSTIFYDIAQFYHASLEDAYKENIGKLPRNYLEMKDKRKEFSTTFYRRNTNRVRDYCIQDCKFTKELAEHWAKMFYRAFGFYPARWISSGYLAEKVLINAGIDIPKFSSIPYEIQELALRCYFGGRFEMLKRGFIGTAHLYDINSAYPFAMTMIPDLTKGKWHRSKVIHPKAKMGFFKIQADIPDCEYLPPFPFRVKGNIIFPSGKFVTYVTLEELNVCKDPKFYKILDSWQFIPSSKNYPYKEFLEKMYLKRLKLKQSKNPLELPIKIILNSIYGKTGQRINKIIGNLFNPVIFAFITGFTRAQLYRFVMENKIERQVVAFATDSICTTTKLGMDSNVLGEFSFKESADDVFYLQNGIYRFNDKWKQRGLGKLGKKEIEHIDTIPRDGKLYLVLKVNRSTQLKLAIIQGRITEIGKIKTIEKQMNLNADRKRLWLGKIDGIDSKVMNDSMPISLNYFEKNRI